ncbi:Secreted beta-glucosidase sun1 [Tolypocladium ophioglossoides CBS 100239]|uniref:Secreted beta-glucosidase sun1 n=1 Tax=Tolypocladium ophioglossoides (strain CBS 100239) TaxID=1163406 RepID=A0A0L0N8L9_TOLOC|nr:Secreted beta-glucosidase sun1 [Tolypocladium ophioglossoides CBS 100239]
MKNLINYTLAAGLAAGAAAHSHNHLHRHVKKDAGSKVEKRQPDVVTEFVVGPTETVYQLGGKLLDAQKAKAGLEGGDYVVVGETTPTYTPPPPPPPPQPTTTSVTKLAAQFIEKPSSSSAPPPPPTTTYQPPPPPKSTQAPAPKPSSTGPSYSGGTGLNAQFPSGQIKCSEFPSQYGAVPLDWLNMGGWAGLQFVPDFSISALSISNIVTGIAGQSCSSGCMCSYACPPGYQKAQWPKAQGATKQSIGGIFCNSDGYLELTRDGSSTLCEPGAGGVTIKNDLSEVVSTCRTDYPGTESMVIPTIAQPGQEIILTNPVQDAYYVWNGLSTSAQYYVNKKGLGAKDACVWNSPSDPTGAGNWSPIIVGVGKAKDGITYISIFPNLPTSNAQLDFNIEIKGDINSKCSYINGQWSGGSNGCTTGMQSGGQATIHYF